MISGVLLMAGLVWWAGAPTSLGNENERRSIPDQGLMAVDVAWANAAHPSAV